MHTPQQWLALCAYLTRKHFRLQPEACGITLQTAQDAVRENTSPYQAIQIFAEAKRQFCYEPLGQTEPPAPDKGEMLEALQAWTTANPPPACAHLQAGCQGLVFGEGNPSAEILFVGEAPGEQEDKQGRPFVGRSGQLLNKLLDAIGLQRADVYITNIVKFRPPNNRDPEPDEKAAFLPTLLEQLDIIEPKVIATLGRHSTQALLPNAKVHEIRGKAQRDSMGRIILPIYHPAAALYNPNNMSALEGQFLSLQALAAGRIKPPAHQQSLF